MGKVVDFESDDQAKDFAREFTKIGVNRPIPPESHVPEWIGNYMVAVAMQRLKLVGAIWFEGEFPWTPDADVEVQVNLNLDKSTLPELLKPYKGYTRSMLLALCRTVEKPTWAE